jgi:hypothetical protein
VDLTGLEFQTAAGWYSRQGPIAIEVRNVSDRALTDAGVMLRIGFGPSSGTGSGHKLGRPLAPGESARIAWRSGQSRGSLSHSEDAASIVALVEQVVTPSCTYRPSQAWPTAERGQSAISAGDVAAR